MFQDGTGYPEVPAGEAIPLAGRLRALAEVRPLHNWSGGEASGGQRALPFGIQVEFQDVIIFDLR